MKGHTVTVRWERGLCPADMYTVHYREVKPDDNTGKWMEVFVPTFANHYNLELKCFKEYEVAVTGSGARTFKPWRVKTGQGKEG